MNPRVYIPSRGRPRNVTTLMLAWAPHDFDIVFMVEPNEFDRYKRAAHDTNINLYNAKIVALPDNNLGAGYSRNMCLQHAHRDGHSSIIMSDDDIKPGRGMYRVLAFADDPNVLGVTIRYSYHDLALGPKIKDRRDPILQPNGMFRIIALNVDNTINIGNYDATMGCADDADLMLRGLAAGYPWMVHLGTWAKSMGGRKEAGGILDLCEQTSPGDDIISLSQKYLHERHPKYVTPPGQKCRVSWRRAYNDYLPEWKEWSALHGGSLDKYFVGNKNG